MLKEVSLRIASHILPFMKRKIYPCKHFEDDVEIDVRSSNPIIFSLSCAIPVVNIWLKITNKSQYLDAVFDRGVFSLWVNSNEGGGPVFNQAHIISKKTIFRKQSDEVFCSFELNGSQIDFLKKVRDSKRITCNLTLTFYIDSQMYHFSKETFLDNRACEISG